MADGYKELVGKYKKSDRKVLHIIVSHGTPIRFFSQFCGMPVKKIKYCGISAIGIDSTKNVND